MARFLLHKDIPPKEGVMKPSDLYKRIAKLESVNDQLAAELAFLESLTRSLGFAEGLKTLKAAALEMLEAERKKKEKKEGETNPPLSS